MTEEKKELVIKKYEISQKQLNETLSILQITMNNYLTMLMSLKEIKQEDKKEK